MMVKKRKKRQVWSPWSIGLHKYISAVVAGTTLAKRLVFPGMTRVNPYSAGIDCGRQILTIKVYPRTVRVKLFLMAVDP